MVALFVAIIAQIIQFIKGTLHKNLINDESFKYEDTVNREGSREDLRKSNITTNKLGIVVSSNVNVSPEGKSKIHTEKK